MNLKSLKLGLSVAAQRELPNARALADEAVLAESLGFDSFWVPEHHFDSGLSQPSPLMLLASVAAATTTIKLGSISYLLPIRNPVLAAEEVAVLDHLCEGRLILGLGRGMQADMFRLFDIPVSEKRNVFQKNLDIMLQAWRGEALGDAEGPQLYPLPLQQPHPPLWVAAFGPKARRQVASLGLPYLASPIESIDKLDEHWQEYDAALREFEQADPNVRPAIRIVYVQTSDADGALMREALSARLPGMATEAMVGSASELKERLSSCVERLKLTHLIASNRLPGLDDSGRRAHLERLRGLLG